jgi:hypothetical protein
VSKQLNEPRIKQNPRRNSIKCPTDNQRRLTRRIISRPESQSDRHPQGRDKPVNDPQHPRPDGPSFEGEDGESGSETEALEHLVEDDDDKEGVEVCPRGRESEPDDHRMKDDAEFEDKEPQKPRIETFFRGGNGKCRDGGFMVFGFVRVVCIWGKMVWEDCCRGIYGGSAVREDGFRVICSAQGVGRGERHVCKSHGE